jgi:formylglycine-generating enzyme required for sulfatase activity
MVQIPAGRGEIGSTSLAAAQPVHTVDFQRFCLDGTEVTVRQYLDCYNSTGTNRCSAPTAPVGSPYTNCNFGVSGYDEHPVNCVTWAQADQYCKWAGKRLPTEEEWEYAARGPLARNFPWGNSVPPDPGTAPASSLVANWNTLDTVPVGTYPGGATPEGALDLAGNLWEWIADLYCPTYDAAPSQCSPVNHSARGGSWASRNTDFLRSWYRDGDTAGDSRFGFRCAL